MGMNKLPLIEAKALAAVRPAHRSENSIFSCRVVGDLCHGVQCDGGLVGIEHVIDAGAAGRGRADTADRPIAGLTRRDIYIVCLRQLNR